MALIEEGGPAAADAERVAPSTRRPPALAEGVELIGEYEGSGYKEAPSLVRRPDGQVIQLPPLLYAVAAAADGTREEAAIAALVSDEIQREVAPDQIAFIVDEKLRSIGVLAAADGSSPTAEKADPFLAFRFRFAVLSERASDRLGLLLKPLFLPVIVLGVLGAFVVADWWLFFQHGVAQSLRESLYHPGLFLPLFLAVVASAAFHEIGHAAGCRYGGGHPGKMGCGIYLAWPAFYTDVTDAYRLGKRARLRTDLGGVYFNIVFVLATVGLYLVTGFEPLLLLVVMQHLEIAHQLLPVVRLDGYYIVADLTGVPDLFARIGPILRSLVPGHERDPKVTALKRWVRVAVTLWVLVVVPLLVFELLVVLVHLPRIIGTAWDSAGEQLSAMGDAFGGGQVLQGITALLQVVVLAIPVIGIVLMLTRTAKGGSRYLWRRTEGRPVARTGLVAAGAAGAVLLAMAWLPGRNYEPIRPGEKGTVAEGISAVRTLPSGGAGPLTSRNDSTAPAATTATPTDAPSLAPPSTQATATTVPADSGPATTAPPRTAPPSSTPTSAPRATTPTTAAPPTTAPPDTAPPTTDAPATTVP